MDCKVNYYHPWKVPLIRWYENILLWFLPAKESVDGDYGIKYKVFRNKIYIIEEFSPK